MLADDPYVVVPKVPGATHYSITGTGFNDTAYYGTHYSAEIDAAGLLRGRTTDPWNNNPPEKTPADTAPG